MTAAAGAARRQHQSTAPSETSLCRFYSTEWYSAAGSRTGGLRRVCRRDRRRRALVVLVSDILAEVPVEAPLGSLADRLQHLLTVAAARWRDAAVVRRPWSDRPTRLRPQSPDIAKLCEIFT